ncbi:MAG TPA: HlyD family efflux transporter periplasmic adaptor subunit [Pirellulaceae bacterium]
MHSESSSEQRSRFRLVAGWRARAAFVAAVAASLLLVTAASRLSSPRGEEEVDLSDLVTTTVWKGPYDYAINTRGAIESAANVEIKCEVRSRGGYTPILDVVPEGSFVNEGDVVVELDDSILREQEDSQKLLISTRMSLLSQAENTLKAAEIAKREYLEGLYLSLEKQMLSDLFIAEKAKESAEKTLAAQKALYEKAIITGLQLQAAYASYDDAVLKFDAAQTNLSTLRTLTKEKEVTTLEAAIDSAEADLKTQQRSLQLEEERLGDIQEQLGMCTIRAPSPGEVVYVNDPEYSRSSTHQPFVVQPGAMVRANQVIIWLPNANEMQIRATVTEARVTMVQPGMPVSIHVEALDEEVLEGVVTRVSQFAEPKSFWSNELNKYAVTIKVKDPPRVLRVGMNAAVWIHVEQVPEALQLPVQALAESKGHFFSLVKEDDEFETREVEIVSVNDQVATIGRGLAEGDEVVINPRSAGELLKLPALPDEVPVALDEAERNGIPGG